MKLKKIFLNTKVIVLLLFIIFSLIAIQPQIFGTEGVSIKSVSPNSSASNAGIQNPSSAQTPLCFSK